MRLTLTDEQDAFPLPPERLEQEIRALAEAAGYTGELSVALVTDERMAELNEHYLGHEGTTDVLAFPLDDDEGEVVVSTERALAEAGARGVDARAELLLYVVHGVLHLLGHDDHDPEEARRMHARSLKLLRSLGYRNRITAPKRE